MTFILVSQRAALLLSFALFFVTKYIVPVKAHFLFARLDEEEQQVRVYFSEAPPVAGEGVTYLGGRVTQLIMIAPSLPDDYDENPYQKPQVIELTEDDDAGYLLGTLPEKADNIPYFLTGFLDYGDYGEGDGPKKDLQYTFSTQISSTNPSDDWSHFLHGVSGTNAKSPFADTISTDIDPFTIALNNYGPPYRVVMRGVSATTPVRVCVYEGSNESTKKVGCVEGTHNRTHHLTFDPDEFGALRPCETYFALANTTVPVNEDYEESAIPGKMKSLWSSTSITWNGPCSAVKPRAAVSQWYKPSTFHFGGGCAKSESARAGITVQALAATEEDSSSSSTQDSSTSSSFKMPLIFTAGFLGGMFAYHMMMWSKNRSSDVAHSKIIDSATHENGGYSDNIDSETEII